MDVIEAVAVAIWERDPDMSAPSDAISRAESILAALDAAGYVVAPKEPTEAMVCAGIVERHDAGVPEAWSLATVNIYRAMIAASQQ